MNAREYLELVGTTNAKINEEMTQLAELKAAAMSMSVSPESERVSSSRNYHRLEDVICKITMLEEKIDKDIDNFIDYKSSLKYMIDMISDEELQTVLCMKYLENRSLSEIGDAIKKRDKISIRTVRRKIAKAIAELQKFAPKNYQ